MLTQSFGAETSANEADTITAVEFDTSGDYLATGDHGGRVVLFARMSGPSSVVSGGSKERSKRRKEIGTSPGDDERRGKSFDKVRRFTTCLSIDLLSFIIPPDFIHQLVSFTNLMAFSFLNSSMV